MIIWVITERVSIHLFEAEDTDPAVIFLWLAAVLTDTMVTFRTLCAFVEDPAEGLSAATTRSLSVMALSDQALQAKLLDISSQSAVQILQENKFTLKHSLFLVKQ